MTVPALMGLPSTPAFSGDQKSPGTPAHHLLCPPTPPAPTGREDIGGIPPGPAGSGPSGRRGTVLGRPVTGARSLGEVGAAAHWPQHNPPT